MEEPAVTTLTMTTCTRILKESALFRSFSRITPPNAQPRSMVSFTYVERRDGFP